MQVGYCRATTAAVAAAAAAAAAAREQHRRNRSSGQHPLPAHWLHLTHLVHSSTSSTSSGSAARPARCACTNPAHTCGSRSSGINGPTCLACTLRLSSSSSMTSRCRDTAGRWVSTCWLCDHVGSSEHAQCLCLAPAACSQLLNAPTAPGSQLPQSLAALAAQLPHTDLQRDVGAADGTGGAAREGVLLDLRKRALQRLGRPAGNAEQRHSSWLVAGDAEGALRDLRQCTLQRPGRPAVKGGGIVT